MIQPTAAGSPLLGTGISSTSDPADASGVGAEFESVFLSMMIKEMRQSLEEGGFFAGENSDSFGGMFDMFIGKHLAQSSPLGIGEMVAEQYAQNQPSHDPTPLSAEHSAPAPVESAANAPNDSGFDRVSWNA